MELQNLLKFNELFHQFRQIKRQILAVNEDRNENVGEHVCQLALVSWYLVSSMKLNLDLEKVLKYSLSHDLIEAYAGDTNLYGSKEDLETKVSREEEALKQLKSNFPECREIWESIEGYEHKIDEESKFVYALDKIITVINNYQDSGRSWHKENITLEMVKKNKVEKVKVSNEINELWNQLVPLLEKDEKILFPK